jgi:hypothetical protein
VTSVAADPSPVVSFRLAKIVRSMVTCSPRVRTRMYTPDSRAVDSETSTDSSTTTPMPTAAAARNGHPRPPSGR